MAKAQSLTVPVDTDRMPPGIPFIIGNEAAERFCFYGMRTILVVFMTKYLLDGTGALAPMQPEEAKGWFHLFVSAVYFLPVFGAILADAFWGKYRTILWLSLVYCAGSFALAAEHTRLGLLFGLALIALGSGGIKPCVSANVGDQFGPRNAHLLSRAFSWFYFSVNFGSFFSTMLTPWLLVNYGPRVAFGVPGVFMLLATVVFWLGRRRFVRVPPAGMDFLRETFSGPSLRLIAGLIPIFLAEAVFWSLWDQTGSAWVLQAEKMDLTTFGFTWLPSQVQAVNPILILALIPLCTYGLYPAIQRFFPLTPLRKIGIGMFITVPSFLITAWVESQIRAGLHPTVWWQFLGFVVISVAEIMVSITFLEFAYTQAPRKLKSLIMSLNLMSISLGNAVTAGINFFIQNPDGTSKLPGATYFLFFAGLMLVTALAFIFIALTYRDRSEGVPRPA
jgi:POT family proton-dependent oligopeptide transporter